MRQVSHEGQPPSQIPEQADQLGTSVRAADASCLNASIIADELHGCIKRLKRNKSPGIDGVLSDMIKMAVMFYTTVY